MESDIKIYIAGHQGLVGSALFGKFHQKGLTNLITRDRKDLDLIDQAETLRFFKNNTPGLVVLTAAKVGGITANIKYPADFLYENLMIAANVIKSAFDTGVKGLLYISSSCIYPRLSEQPMKEESIFSGPFEPENEGYSIAKITGLKLCSFFRKQYGVDYYSVIPTNLYGPRDHFDPASSHVIPALLKRFHEAKENSEKKVTVWGTGDARREFLFVEDFVEAIYLLISVRHGYDTLNIGFGKDITIRELAETISDVVGYKGKIEFDSSKPEGMKKKLVDNSRISNLGWKPKTSLEEGLLKTYDWFLKNKGVKNER
ncbi:MAG TPA: GDP-L-fucose synthase [Thermotogota bacterium]|nr:GDP-L-fucose synthase [Thermotogota bacterium]